jgi:Domain of unknown function (DUF4185)
MQFLLNPVWEGHQHEGSWHLVLSRVTVLFFALGIASTAVGQTGMAWPEADELFHSDSRWLGADGAFSVDLGGGRVLWMFGDSFVARKPGDERSHSAFVRNTVAIQSGYDPSHATIKFYWQTRRGSPSEIFPSEGPVWMWPGSGIRIGNRLLLFCQRVASDSAKDSLGFKSVGWSAYWVTNPDDEPNVWKLKIATEVSDTTMTMASQALRDDGFVYLFGQSEPEHHLYMARSSIENFAKGKLSPLQWWSDTGWQTDSSKRSSVLPDAGTETSVQHDPGGMGFIEVNSEGFGASTIVMRRARNLEGPWSPPKMIYRPPESDAPDAFVYAGKSHPELKGADLILTYVANGPDEKVAKDMSLYFPRFVKVELHSREPAQ